VYCFAAAYLVIAHSTTGVRGPGLWDEVCSPKMQWWSLLVADLYVIEGVGGSRAGWGTMTLVP